MGRQLLAALYVVVMIAIIVGVDVAFLRQHFWARLFTNIGIVVLFGAFYLGVLRNR